LLHKEFAIYKTTNLRLKDNKFTVKRQQIYGIRQQLVDGVVFFYVFVIKFTVNLLLPSLNYEQYILNYF